MRLRRMALATATLALAAPVLLPSSGCSAPFDPASDINSLRILAVEIDKPYAKPGDEVELKMTYADAVDLENPRKVQITWLGGCFDPVGDQYYACYEPLGEILQGVASGGPIPEGLIAQGVGIDRFTLRIPEDIVSRRPVPKVGPHYGIAYVFFMACAGQVGPVEATGDGAAGDFPLGCFDDAGNRLGSESFVPGYTQIYAFADERENSNPTATALRLDGSEMSEDFAEIPVVPRCDVTDEERRSVSCDNPEPLADCKEYKLDIDIGDVAEVDPESQSADGGTIREAIWVSYFADAGDLSSAIKLVSDATTGPTNNHDATWVAPAEPGVVTIWAVVRDARGGSSVQQRFVRVE